jgi:phospholipid/cholesterol/gamma-HCH transport system permease protein
VAANQDRDCQDTGTDAAAQVQVSQESGGVIRVALKGRFDARTTVGPWHQLEGALAKAKAKPARLEVDASGIEYCDGAGLALLQFLRLGGLHTGLTASIQGLKPEFQKFFDRFSPEDYQKYRTQPRIKPHVAEEIGLTVRGVFNDLRDQVAFLGSLTRAFVAVLPHPRRMRWGEILRVFELAGVNALPIVSLISLLVGLIIAFEAAQPLAQFGAQIFIANMIGLLMIRELGPMMTAIMLAGRSGSAFAAELGTMKVNEELNALETMGLDPVRFLVVQRIIAGILLAPILTFYSMFMGVLGGVIVMLGLGFPLVAIYHQMVNSISLHDIWVGSAKSIVFGMIVGGLGCLRGLQTRKGPSAVGESTTRAVVSSILLIIIADAVFALGLFIFDK